jgi:hypothetical protein
MVDDGLNNSRVEAEPHGVVKVYEDEVLFLFKMLRLFPW